MCRVDIDVSVICYYTPTTNWNQIEAAVSMNQYLILDPTMHILLALINTLWVIHCTPERCVWKGKKIQSMNGEILPKMAFLKGAILKSRTS